MQALRSYAFAVYITLATIVLAVVFLPTLLMGRRAAMYAIKVWARAFLDGLRRFCGLSYRVLDQENIPKSGAIVASKHQTQWETIALTLLLPDPVYIMKRELLWVPIVGWWAARGGMISIDRKGGAKALRRMTETAKRRIAEGGQIIIFPEGTRTPPGEQAPYKPGVAALYTQIGAPCAPVAHNSGCYWLHPGFRRVPGVIDIAFMPAIPPGAARRQFEAELRDRIETKALSLLPDRQGLNERDEGVV
ncbi:MAG: lysophospholipid acyltransferase family protein, partial [Pseudomonadota bacterium]